MRDLFENPGRWYGLSFDAEGNVPAIRVLVLEANVEGLSSRIKGIVHHYGDLFFEWNLKLGFGIDTLIRSEGVRGDYRYLRVELVKGSAYRIAEQLSELFSLLFAYASLSDVHCAFDPDRQQLLRIQTGLRDGSDGSMAMAPIGGLAYAGLLDWIAMQRTTKNRQRLPVVEEAMWRACNAFRTEKVARRIGPSTFSSFETRLEKNGSFLIQTLGNTCDVSTYEAWHRKTGEAHELGCHNVDSPVQQLSLIAGLAALHDVASKALDTKPP